MDAVVTAQPDEGRQIVLRSGRRLGVSEYGDPDGLPVLAFHGAPACRTMFDVAHGAARDAALRIIAFDRPGYGLSPLDYGATLSSRTDTFLELVEALQLDRFAVIGVSGGGPYAVALAARLGRRILALGLVSPLGPVADVGARSSPDPVHLSVAHRTFFLDLPRHPWLLRFNAEVAVRSFHAAPKLLANSFLHLLPNVDREIVERPDVVRSVIAMTLEATRNGISGGIADLEIYSEPWHVDYSGIAAPSRLWIGEEDSVVPIEVAVRLGELIPGCEVIRKPAAGHFWIYGAIPEVLAQVGAMAGTEAV